MINRSLLFSFLLLSVCLPFERVDAAVLIQKPASIYISQENQLFIQYSLLIPGEPSQLCGLTSLGNFINLSLSKQNKQLQAPELIKLISEFANEYYEQQIENGNRHFKIKGMYPHDLAEMSQAIFNQLKLPISADVRSELLDGKEVRPQDVSTSLGAIWALTFTPEDPTQDEAGHFILVLKYDKKTRSIVFVDPLAPEIRKSARVTFSTSDELENRIRLELVDGSDMSELVGQTKGQFRLTGLVKFTSKKK